MGLARRRVRRAAVIGPAPVARTAATVATAAVVTYAVVRRRSRRRSPLRAADHTLALRKEHS